MTEGKKGGICDFLFFLVIAFPTIGFKGNSDKLSFSFRFRRERAITIAIAILEKARPMQKRIYEPIQKMKQSWKSNNNIGSNIDKSDIAILNIFKYNNNYIAFLMYQ